MRRLLFCNPATYTASVYLKRQQCALAAADAWCVPRALDRGERRESWGGEQSDDRRPHTAMYGHWWWANHKCNLRANFFWKRRRIVGIKVIHCPATPSLALISTSVAVEAWWQINTAVAVTVTTLNYLSVVLTAELTWIACSSNYKRTEPWQVEVGDHQVASCPCTFWDQGSSIQRQDRVSSHCEQHLATCNTVKYSINWITSTATALYTFTYYHLFNVMSS